MFERHYARYADYQRHALTALNTANAQDGALIVVEDEGREYWVFEGERIATMGLNAVAGKPPEFYNVNPTLVPRAAAAKATSKATSKTAMNWRMASSARFVGGGTKGAP